MMEARSCTAGRLPEAGKGKQSVDPVWCVVGGERKTGGGKGKQKVSFPPE